MTRSRRTAASLLCVAVLGLGLTACPGQAAVCSSAATLSSSISSLQNLQPGQDTVGELTSQLKTIRGQVEQLAADATVAYQLQVGVLQARLDRLASDVSAAVANPSSASYSQVKTDAGALESAVEDVKHAVSASC